MNAHESVPPLDLARVLVVAEAGVNHNGDVDRARKLIREAHDSGADAVKFQTFRARDLILPGTPLASYQAINGNPTSDQYQMLERLELSASAHHALKKYADDLGILFLSTPFDSGSLALLVDVGVSAFKIASPDVTHLPFLAEVARLARTVILSTGMSTLEEVARAVETIHENGNPPLVLLHCTSAYPAAPEDANLRAIHTLARAFKLPVGYSDHTMGIEVALAAVALGARVIEKHFTLSRALPGPDHSFSLEPGELKGLVDGIRTVERALGSGEKAPRPCELELRTLARRSLVTRMRIPAGSILTAEMLTAKRPGTGISPADLPRVVNRVVLRDLSADTPLDTGMLA